MRKHSMLKSEIEELFRELIDNIGLENYTPLESKIELYQYEFLEEIRIPKINSKELMQQLTILFSYYYILQFDSKESHKSR